MSMVKRGATEEVDMPQRRLSRGFVLLLLPLLLAACAETVGAGAGALVGNQFGKGSGKTAATVGGAVGGALIGHELAR